MTTKLAQSMTLFTVLLLEGVLLTIGCGAGGTVPEAPANQRYWHESGNFAVLHWDTVPNARSYEVYYFRDTCSRDGPCREDSLGETSSTSAAVYIDMGLYSYRCDQGPICSRGPFLRQRHPQKTPTTCPMTSGSQHAHVPDVPILRASVRPQRLDSPDGSLPDTPSGFEAEKVNKKEAPDDAQVTWEPVHGATSYEIWVGTVPSSAFTLGERVKSHGLDPFSLEGEKDLMLHVEGYNTPTNRGTFGEFSTTSWKLRACTDAGCSPFTAVLTVN